MFPGRLLIASTAEGLVEGWDHNVARGMEEMPLEVGAKKVERPRLVPEQMLEQLEFQCQCSRRRICWDQVR